MTNENKESNRATAIVSFHFCDKLTNVNTGVTEQYCIETRNGLLCSINYVVKIEHNEDDAIEYDLFPLHYNRFEAEPEASLYDYLLYKYQLSNDRWNALYDGVIFKCPDTAEAYTMDYVRNKYKEGLKALFGEMNERAEKENVEK